MKSSEKIGQGISLFAEGLIEVFSEIATKLCEICEPVLLSINNLQNKKMTKNKFIGILQSSGIQRNQINKIISKNKESYTFKRLSETLNLYKK